MKEKKLHIEFLRMLSILLVIFNHTGKFGYLYFTDMQDSPLHFVYFFFSVLCKIAVPLFWMVSGAVLIDKEESLSELFRRRVLRIFLVLTVFSFLYYLYSALDNPDFSFSPLYFAKLLYSVDMAPAFWFLYSYLGMLILLPLLRKLAKNLTNTEFLYFFLAMLLLRGLLPVLEYAFFHGETTLNPNFSANFLSYDLVFFLAGYYLEKRVTSLTWKRAGALLIFGLASLLIILSGTQLLLNDGGSMTDANAERFYAGLLLLPSAAVYYTARLCFLKVKPDSAFAGFVRFGGSVSFGVMLLEHFVRCESTPVIYLLRGFLPPLLSCVLWVIFIYFVCAAVTAVLRRIPFVRKYI